MSDENDRHDRHARLVSTSIRIYRKLLWAYPEEFQQEYAEEMARYFQEICLDSLREGGILALLMTWMRTLVELVRSVRAERKQIVPDVDVNAPSAAALSLLVWPGTGQAYNKRLMKSLNHALFAPLLLLYIGLVFEPRFFLGIVVVLWAYSVIEALVEARRINAAQRDS